MNLLQNVDEKKLKDPKSNEEAKVQIEEEKVTEEERKKVEMERIEQNLKRLEKERDEERRREQEKTAALSYKEKKKHWLDVTIKLCHIGDK